MTPAPLLTPSNKRGNWLGKVVEQLKNETDPEQFESIYKETITQLKWKYLPCKQLTLHLHQPEPRTLPITCTQLKMFAA